MEDDHVSKSYVKAISSASKTVYGSNFEALTSKKNSKLSPNVGLPKATTLVSRNAKQQSSS